MARIFLSYRRVDSGDITGRLRDHLTKYFEPGDIFRDIDIIRPGDDFVVAINTFMDTCDALIAVIGTQWLTVEENGIRRLDHPNDYVRHEIAAALRRNIRVIPVLVQRAGMPREQDLPPDIASLARRNAVELSSDRFEYDVQRIAHAIGGSQSTLMFRLAFKPKGTITLKDGNSVIAKISGKEYSDPIKLQVANGEHQFHAIYTWMKDLTIGNFRTIPNPTNFQDLMTIMKSDVLSLTTRVGQVQPVTLEIEQTAPAQYQIIKDPSPITKGVFYERKEQTAPAQYRIVLKPY